MVEEILQLEVNIAANNKKDAIHKAMQMYYNEDIVLDASHFVHAKFKEVKDGTRGLRKL